MTTKAITVSLGKRSYEIRVGKGALRTLPRGLSAEGRKAFVFFDPVLSAHSERLKSALEKARWKVVLFPVAADEGLKEFSRIYPLYGELLRSGADRHSVLFALGGGALGDAIGFLASTFMRGVRWVGLPSTLLAQVDSSIGGKTGINHEIGKNLIGAFHQPALVVCDTDLLATLPERELVSGLAEIVKYALIYDPEFLRWLEKNWRLVLARNPAALTSAISKSAHWKSKAVSRDELDLSGVREVLNFGHTIGHAIESLAGYGTFRHGEAVFLGMRAAARISMNRGHLKPPTYERIDALLAEFPVPALPDSLDPARIVDRLRFDKKSRGGKVRFVLLKGIGKTVLDPEVSPEDVVAAVRFIIRKA